jgi:hypothetical protein
LTDRVWRVSSGVAFVQSPDGGRVAVLNLAEDVPVILVGTAASVWNGLDGFRNEADLIETLAHDYGTSSSAIQNDVMRLIHELSSAGMIAVSPPEKVAS